jgi:hypothetical protein
MKWDLDWKKLGHFKKGDKNSGHPFRGNGKVVSAANNEGSSSGSEAGGREIKSKVSGGQVSYPANIRPPSVGGRQGGAYHGGDSNSNVNDNRSNSNNEVKPMATSRVVEDQLSDTAVSVISDRPKQSNISRASGSSSGSSQRRTENLRKDDKSPRRRGRDLSSGMELFELDFVLNVVENVKSFDPKDVTMRKINFNELIRRQKLSEADSTALKAYAMNENDLYGKDIQFEAMKELAERTNSK